MAGVGWRWVRNAPARRNGVGVRPIFLRREKRFPEKRLTTPAIEQPASSFGYLYPGGYQAGVLPARARGVVRRLRMAATRSAALRTGAANSV